mmetsp:Transcript_80924/g.142700  ORF Transcript_80924/g.142700 Transcript_80924/m.142700 type:complete len:215 (+) Transcript_80924:674-1318(+)
MLSINTTAVFPRDFDRFPSFFSSDESKSESQVVVGHARIWFWTTWLCNCDTGAHILTILWDGQRPPPHEYDCGKPSVLTLRPSPSPILGTMSHCGRPTTRWCQEKGLALAGVMPRITLHALIPMESSNTPHMVCYRAVQPPIRANQEHGGKQHTSKARPGYSIFSFGETGFCRDYRVYPPPKKNRYFFLVWIMVRRVSARSSHVSTSAWQWERG